MSKWKKVKERIISKPKDLTIEEVAYFLESLGYGKIETVSHENMILFNDYENRLIIFNNSSGIIDEYSLDMIIHKLRDTGDL